MSASLNILVGVDVRENSAVEGLNEILCCTVVMVLQMMCSPEYMVIWPTVCLMVW